MKIHLDQIELEEIIKQHLIDQMPDLTSKTFQIQLIAGRGDNGHRAEVEIVSATPPAEAVPTTSAAPAEDESAVPFDFGGGNDED